MSKTPEKYQSPYNPNIIEDAIYATWEQSGFFNPDNLPGTRTDVFSTIMPPPNANGRLHVGHGLDMTLKDIAVRFERMRGKKTLFVPGADHAGFETQMVFEKKLAKEGGSRFGMSREDLYKAIYDFTMENKRFMEDDIRKLGTSCDWSRKLFTLDPRVISQVEHTFIKMYEDKLVYRGHRIVNWNPKYQTSLSDIETEFVEQTDPFYYLQYGPFVIGTVRPETKFGDKYVVMHPDDKRYAQYTHGQTIELEWINGPLTATIIKDDAIDMEFGTGVMTITPWHDQTDFEIAERHNLPKEQVIDWDGKLLPIAEEFAGMKILDARPKIIDKLRAKGLVVKVDESYTHPVRICERTKVVIEPQIKSQWFINMKTLAQKVITAIETEKQITFLPDHQKKILLHWMHNSIDWNISRQIVWGIPIPAWFKGDDIYVGTDAPHGDGWVKDTDTFDTWFSSGQWPLLTLGYPDSPDMETYYPTTLMETGSDLVFKWVPRMIMFGLYLTGTVPFKTVYFHGMINDAHNQKMSKSKGNVISPIAMSETYGTDALRMALIVGNTPGGSIALSEDKIRAYKKFANKIWNITRFILDNTTPYTNTPPLTARDSEICTALDTLATDITADMSAYRYYLASEKLYHYIWHTLADIIIEEKKHILNAGTEEEKVSAQYTLRRILRTCVILLHPFMPFITEEIWKDIKHADEDLLMVTSWPTGNSHV